MDAVEFFKNVNRLCKNYKGCSACPVWREGCCMDGFDDDSVKNIEETISIVEQWAKDHQVKTRQSEFLKMFPDAKIGKDGALIIYPCAIEKRLSGKKCGGIFCDDCRREYWLAEVTENE